MYEKEKTTVPVPSVGADGEQSLSYVTEEIVTQEPDYFNFDDGKHGDEYLEHIHLLQTRLSEKWASGKKAKHLTASVQSG